MNDLPGIYNLIDSIGDNCILKGIADEVSVFNYRKEIFLDLNIENLKDIHEMLLAKKENNINNSTLNNIAAGKP